MKKAITIGVWITFICLILCGCGGNENLVEKRVSNDPNPISLFGDTDE